MGLNNLNIYAESAISDDTLRTILKVTVPSNNKINTYYYRQSEDLTGWTKVSVNEALSEIGSYRIVFSTDESKKEYPGDVTNNDVEFFINYVSVNTKE